jgi:predicted MFS family arabinose efflux permease
MVVPQTALLLGSAAFAYVPGNLLARRTIDGTSGRPLAMLVGAAALGALVFGIARSSIGFSAAVFALLAAVGGARTFAGSIRGMTLAPDARVAVTGLRAAATQFGYLLGSGLGGVALAAGGYTGLALMLSSLFALATLPHLGRDSARARARRAMRPSDTFSGPTHRGGGHGSDGITSSQVPHTPSLLAIASRDQSERRFAMRQRC